MSERTRKDLKVDAISEDGIQPFTVTSPRSVEALRGLGVLVEELQYCPPEAFHEPGVSEEIMRMRYEHNETRRRELIKEVKQEYRSICSSPGGLLPVNHHADKKLLEAACPLTCLLSLQRRPDLPIWTILTSTRMKTRRYLLRIYGAPFPLARIHRLHLHLIHPECFTCTLTRSASRAGERTRGHDETARGYEE